MRSAANSYHLALWEASSSEMSLKITLGLRYATPTVTRHQ